MALDDQLSPGRRLLAAGRLVEAASAFEELLRRSPGSADGYAGLGQALHGSGDLGRAIDCFRRALDLAPDAIVAGQLGVVLCQAGRLKEAVPAFEAALSLNPSYLEARINLGATRAHLGAPDAGMAHIRVALALKPDLADSWMARASTAFAFQRTAEADASTARVLALSAGHGAALALRSLLCRQVGRFGEAYRLARLAAVLDPRQGAMLAVAAVALRDIGRSEEAVRLFRRALTIEPANAAIRSAFVMCLNYVSSATPSDLLIEARRWEKWHAPPPRTIARPRPSARRPLRVGLVSGDLRRHAVGYFLAGMLPALDRSRVRIVCFATAGGEDDFTRRLRSASSAWHDISTIADDDAFDLVRREDLDILVDMSGYTAGARLALFALKPAPVQAAWIGYFGTTGLSAIDWLIADRHLVPPGEDRWFSERILRLPDSYVCYAPPAEAPAIAPPPSAVTGTVTFGSCNALAKITPSSIALWARIMAQVPGSRLLLKTGAFDASAARRQITVAFGEHGIAADRLCLEGWTSYPQFLNTYGRIDIALDSYPFCGGLTTVETLWMGVPLVSLASDRFAGRQSLSYLSTIGHGDLCARTTEDFVALGVRLASDGDARQRLRSRLRADMAASPLLDAPRFARHLEAAFERMVAE